MNVVSSVLLGELSQHLLPAYDRVFLDTGIQKHRLWGDDESQTAIATALEGWPVATSSSVFRECQAQVMDILYFLSRLVREEDYNDVHQRLDELEFDLDAEPDKWEFDASDIRFGLQIVRDAFPRAQNPLPDQVADRLLLEIQITRDSRFFEVGTTDIHYVDKAACEVAAQPVEPHRRNGVRCSCRTEVRSCEIRTFIQPLAKTAVESFPVSWHDRRTHGSSAATEIATWGDAERNSTQAIGADLCWPLADAVVLAEAAAGDVVLTTDLDLREIGPALQRNVVVIEDLQ